MRKFRSKNEKNYPHGHCFVNGDQRCFLQKDSSGDNGTIIIDPIVTAPTYYLNFKAGGVVVNETEFTVIRSTTTNPRTLVITATAKNGAVPKFKFYLAEPSVVGFSSGLTIGNSVDSYPGSYVEYTNSANVLYSSRYSTYGDPLSFGILNLSYTKGGIIKGVFSGTLKTDKGASLNITEGTYNLQFSN